MMYGGIPLAFLPDDLKKHFEQAEKASMVRRLKNCVPWDPKMKFSKELNLQASTYSVRNLFPEVRPNDTQAHPNRVKVKTQYADSPGGKWRYMLNIMHRGQKLTTWFGRSVGSVTFDADVHIPAIYTRDWRKFERDGETEYEIPPWMSLTPAEIMSLRTGTRRAKGRVVIAGLGLGHQLIEVCKKKSVKEVVVVEIDQELVDWLWPRIEPLCNGKVREVIVGDAYKEMPKLTADVGLVDIFKSYGSNYYEMSKFERDCKTIPTLWGWGTSAISDSSCGYW